MLSKCANPSCAAPFLYFHSGKLFRVEQRRPVPQVEPSMSNPSRCAASSITGCVKLAQEGRWRAGKRALLSRRLRWADSMWRHEWPYWPVMAYSGSENFPDHSHAVAQRVKAGAGAVRPRTGTSTVRNPSLRARKRISGSKPQRSIFCRGKMRCAASRRNALNPHCVSRKLIPAGAGERR